MLKLYKNLINGRTTYHTDFTEIKQCYKNIEDEISEQQMDAIENMLDQFINYDPNQLYITFQFQPQSKDTQKVKVSTS